MTIDPTTPGSEDADVPLSDLFPGLTVTALARGAAPIDAFILIKYLDHEGYPNWAYRVTDGCNSEELLGALSVQVDLLVTRLRRLWDEG